MTKTVADRLRELEETPSLPQLIFGLTVLVSLEDIASIRAEVEKLEAENKALREISRRHDILCDVYADIKYRKKDREKP